MNARAAVLRLRAIGPSLAAGLIAALAHPPFGLIVGVLAYGAIMLLAERAGTLKAAFFRGWLAGVSYFALSCWWVTEAFFVDAETFGWMAPFAISLLAGGLALFWGLASLAYRALRPRGAWRFVVFAGVLAAAEWVRGHIFTGFPWNLPGTSWAAGGPVSQAAHLFGAYGLSWLTIAIGAAPFVLLDSPRRPSAFAAVAIAVLCLAGLYGYGFSRLRADPPARGEGWLAVRVVQPDIPQHAKYDQALYRQIVDRYLSLTARPPKDGEAWPRLIVWPEGALPVSLDDTLSPGDLVHAELTRILAPGQTLILGGWRSEYGRDGRRRSYNTLVAVEREATGLRISGVYDKHHLVPFGEYVPRFAQVLGLQQLVPLEPFTPGPKPTPLDIGLARIQPLICYEALFPGYVARGSRLSGRSADLIVNISNDAWFGRTSGPWQHSNQARYRAIEEGLPMVRATPTGVSSVIDKYGRIAPGDKLGPGLASVIDAQVYTGPRQDVASSNAYSLSSSHLPLRSWGFLAMLAVSCLTSVTFYARRSKKYVT